MISTQRCNNPYYIYVPDFISTSAGIKALYILCDRLNKRGCSAYIVSSNKTTKQYHAPLLKGSIFWNHLIKKTVPIVVYPEVVIGNPLNAPFYVRYYFCFNGQFGVDLRNDKANVVYAFSQDICDDVVKTDNIMFIPTVDLSIFYPPKNPTERKGFCYAALKYKYFHGEKIDGIPHGGVEITRDLPDSQTKEELAELFRTCEYFYCFDNSALALEATLCGCTVILMKNKYFDRLIGEQELFGLAGMAWNDDQTGIEKAKKNIQDAYPNYLKVVDRFETEIEKFIRVTQDAIQKESLYVPRKFFLNILLKRIKNLPRSSLKKLYHQIIWRFPFTRKPLHQLKLVVKGLYKNN